jgi:hypothetical protein
MKTISLFTVTLLLIFSLSLIGIIPSNYVNAQASVACEGLVGCYDAEGDPQTNSVLETSINLLSVIAGIIAVVMLIIAGVKFITSGGDAGKVASARNTALYAIIGVVIVAVSQALVFFVIDSTTPKAPESSAPANAE